MFVFRNLFAEMARYGKRHEDMAIMLNITRKTFSKKTRNESEFTLSEINKMISFFKKPFDYLFKLDELK